jgi:zinc transport system substrate-binding protein
MHPAAYHGRQKRKGHILALFALTVFVTGVLAGRAEAEGLRVVASLKPIHALAAAILSGVSEPGLIVQGAGSEHAHVMRPSEADLIAEADLIIWVGPIMEDYLVRPLAALPKHARVLTLIDLTDLTRLPVRKGGAFEADADAPNAARYDGHIWLDPVNALTIARAIRTEIVKLDPAHAAAYEANAAKLEAALAALDTEIRTRMVPLKNRPVVVFHDAYHYFEARYGLDVVGAITVDPDVPVSARRVADIRTRILSLGEVCVFAEPQFEPKLVTSLTEGTKARRGVLDPLGAALKPGPGAYFALLRNLMDSLQSCLLP